MSKINETIWSISTSNSASITDSHVSTNSKYSFGFTGWKLTDWKLVVEEEPDPFNEWVHEVRKDAGIIDPEPPKPRARWVSNTGTTASTVGQILFSGNIMVKQPRFHSQLAGITGGKDED